MAETTKWRQEGFERHQELGFESDIVKIYPDEKVIKPAWSVEHLLDQGFYPRGTKVVFTNTNGYDMERERAAEVFSTNKEYTIKSCNVGDWSSKYTFEEVDGTYNTVMFKKV